MSSKFLLSAAGLIASWLALPHHGLADAPDGYRATFEDPASAEASAIRVMQVDAASYVESLAAFGARLPPPRVGGSRPPASQAEALAEMKEMVLDYALDRFPHELVEVVIDLGDVPFPELKQLRSMDEETRGRLLAERVERIEAGQEGIRPIPREHRSQGRGNARHSESPSGVDPAGGHRGRALAP